MTKPVESISAQSMIETLENKSLPVYPLTQIENDFRADLIIAGICPELVERLTVQESPSGTDGDFGIHCGQLSKSLKKSPQELAQEISQKLQAQPDSLIERYIAVGPYINSYINYDKFSALVLENVLALQSDYGKESIGHGQKIILDMSSPNIAKRMSIGHLRSTIIGDSLAKIFKHLDYEVVKDNHLGDWGTQFGHLLRAIELWGDADVIKANPIEELQKLYVRISNAGDPKSDLYSSLDKAEATAKAELVKDEGRAWFKKLEEGDPQARVLWQQIVEWSMLEFQQVYDTLGVTFDWARGESYYETQLKDAIQKVRESGITTNSEGALVVNMEDKELGTAIIQKSDGATLYLTREIATGIHRSDTEKADGMIYVVGEDQRLYFQQFFEILKRMGLPIADKCKHVYFGMIRMEEGKMSTRKGRIILLQDVINEAISRTREIVDKSEHLNEDEDKDKLIRQVAIGAIKWNDLMSDPKRSVVFDWDSMLALDGKSAPYVQYSFVRAHSILERVEGGTLKNVAILPQEKSEKELVKLIAQFPGAVKLAGETYNPSKIATHVYNLAKAFNSFYHDQQVLNEPIVEKRNSRLAITAITAQTIQIGLNLLGIETPTKM